MFKVIYVMFSGLSDIYPSPGFTHMSYMSYMARVFITCGYTMAYCYRYRFLKRGVIFSNDSKSYF